MSPLDPRVLLLRSSPSVGAVPTRAHLAACVVGGPGLAWPRGGSGAPSPARAVGCDGTGALGSVRGGR